MIQFLARQRALLKQVFAAVIHLLLSIESLPGGLQFKFCLLHFGWQIRSGADGIYRLRLIVRALGILGRGGEVFVLEHSQQLPLMHVAASLHIERLNRGADLGHDCRLRQGKQNRVRNHRVLDSGFLNRRHLHRHDRFLVSRLFRTT